MINTALLRRSDRILGIVAGSTGMALSFGAGDEGTARERTDCSLDKRIPPVRPKLYPLNGRAVKSSRGLFQPSVVMCDDALAEKEKKVSRRHDDYAPYPSWIRRTLSALSLVSLPLPRVTIPHDPELTLPRRHVRERQRCDRALQKLQVEIQTTIQNGGEDVERKMGELLMKSYEILYGPKTHPQHRQTFLQQYGCTGWTEPALVSLLELGASRGFVEIGAGNGQWARVLNDRYVDSEYFTKNPKKAFEFCLAYDDMSALPLNPDIYHERTKPYHDHFYPNVQPCESIANVLSQWQCRGRVLLLVYPSPDSDMATNAIRSYSEISPLNDTVVYVGEGRGGANANDSFFDYLENGEWVLWKIEPAKVFGNKGFEKLYIFKRRLK